VNGLVKKNNDLYLFSLTSPGSLLSAYDKRVKIETLDYNKINIQNLEKSFWTKALYLFALPRIWLATFKFKPDIIHSHYASSYGLLGVLTFKKPLIVSLWGSDIFDFPQKNFISNFLTRFILKKASIILSTSHIMAKEGKKYTSKDIEVTPFGVDLNSFIPKEQNVKIQKPNNKLVIGIVKLIAEKYGISNLVKAFKIVSEKIKDQKLELLIVGDGPQRKEIENLVRELKLEQVTTFTGLISPHKIVSYYQEIDIAVFPSISDSESFGSLLWKLAHAKYLSSYQMQEDFLKLWTKA
jgi:glycosyltransferase involved in cell wall biosynthesis